MRHYKSAPNSLIFTHATESLKTVASDFYKIIKATCNFNMSPCCPCIECSVGNKCNTFSVCSLSWALSTNGTGCYFRYFSPTSMLFQRHIGINHFADLVKLEF